MALLIANKAEQLKHSGGSPTPTKGYVSITNFKLNWLPFVPRIPMGFGVSRNRAILKSIGISLEAGGLYSCNIRTVIGCRCQGKYYTHVLWVSNCPESWSNMSFSVSQ